MDYEEIGIQNITHFEFIMKRVIYESLQAYTFVQHEFSC
jgi:hypothetical protein